MHRLFQIENANLLPRRELPVLVFVSAFRAPERSPSGFLCGPASEKPYRLASESPIIQRRIQRLERSIAPFLLLVCDNHFIVPSGTVALLVIAQAPQTPIEDVREVIREELGEYPETLWRSFEPEAIASASLAQVHRAEGWNGEQLAVKVWVHARTFVCSCDCMCVCV